MKIDDQGSRRMVSPPPYISGGKMTFLDRTQVSSFSVLLCLITVALSDLLQLKQLSLMVFDAQSRPSIGTVIATVALRELALQFWTRSSFGHATLTSPRSTG